MKQLELDQKIRAQISAHGQIHHALAYGSFTQGIGDEWSDLEYYLFVADPNSFSIEAWISQITPVHLLVVNEFGTPNILTDDLIRIELHVEPSSRLEQILDWPNEHIYPEQMLIKDSDQKLEKVLLRLSQKPGLDPEAELQQVWDRLLNWFVFGSSVLARGERIRALELRMWIQVGLLRLARLSEGNTQHWLNEARRAEWELSSGSLERFAQTAGSIQELETSYARAWVWAKELKRELQAKLEANDRKKVVEMLDSRLNH